MDELKFEIVKTIGTISDHEGTWQKELNLVKWNDREAKYDLRAWDKTHERMKKGITFTTDELRRLRELLNSIDI